MGRRDDVVTSYGIDYRLERPTRLSVLKAAHCLDDTDRGAQST